MPRCACRGSVGASTATIVPVSVAPKGVSSNLARAAMQVGRGGTTPRTKRNSGRISASCQVARGHADTPPPAAGAKKHRRYIYRRVARGDDARDARTQDRIQPAYLEYAWLHAIFLSVEDRQRPGCVLSQNNKTVCLLRSACTHRQQRYGKRPRGFRVADYDITSGTAVS